MNKTMIIILAILFIGCGEDCTHAYKGKVKDVEFRGFRSHLQIVTLDNKIKYRNNKHEDHVYGDSIYVCSRAGITYDKKH
ncbi:MAG: hypothetical protein H8E12_15400 [Rhodobacteraceae bacterium]|nr:hypothetical protein [Paracoccaceae bacterium]